MPHGVQAPPGLYRPQPGRYWLTGQTWHAWQIGHDERFDGNALYAPYPHGGQNVQFRPEPA